MNDMMDINKIKNSTLAKLTTEEVANLWLQNYGVGLYRGDLKTRYNGMKRIRLDENTVAFESETRRIEFVELVSSGEMTEYAARMWDKEKKAYDTYPMGIYGCYFFR